MVAPVELVRSVLTEDWSDDYAASDHWSRYWNAVSAPSDDECPEGLTEDGDKSFLKDKLLVPENRMEELIDHWHNAQIMHPGRDKMQQDLEWRFKFPPGYYAILDKYCSDCAVCRATKSPNHSTAGNPVYTAIPDVRFSCNLYFRFFQSIFLIYVYKRKSAISALFWTVLVSVNQEFL